MARRKASDVLSRVADAVRTHRAATGRRPRRVFALALLLAGAPAARAALGARPPDGTSSQLRGVAGGAASRERSLEAGSAPSQQDGGSLIAVLGCGACHAGVPQPGVKGVALAPADLARDPAATFAYLLDPPPRSPGAARMPSFHLDDAEALALALYLAGGRSGRGEARDRFDAARRAHRDVDASAGERVFHALNCGACHAGAAQPRSGAAAPPLAGVGQRLRAGALRDYIRRPSAVRPFGYVPGDGARMPDFRLSAAEADSIAAVLLIGARSDVAGPLRPLSPFAQQKARDLLQRRLSCLGCHALEGNGGRVGPELSRAASRLQPSYLRAVIDDPEHATPGTVMPRAALAESTRGLIVAFLAGLAADTSAGARAGYLSLIEHEPITAGEPSHAESAAALYARRCAACHGARGRGEGYNARYLRARPADHASAQAMGRRPDDTLYDGIHAGALILGGSVEMPAYGQSLTPEQIRTLVRYIRELCACTQPSWAGGG